MYIEHLGDLAVEINISGSIISITTTLKQRCNEMSPEHQPTIDFDQHLVLATDLLKDCFLSCFEELVRSEGSEKVLSAIKLYGYNAGFAGAANIKERLSIKDKEPRSMAMVWSFAHNSFRRKPDFRIGPNWCVGFVRRCAHLSGGPEICMLECISVGKGMAESFGDDVEFVMTTSIGAQDDCCTQIYKQKSTGIASIMKELPSLVWEKELVPIPDKEALIYYRAYLSEFWLFVVRSSIDLIGEERTFALLKERMYRSGVKWGPILHREFVQASGHNVEIAELIDMINGLLQQKGGGIVQLNDMAIKEIEICPFSSAPLETCRLFEEFINGVITSVDANHKFKYQKTMNDGAGRCVWMLNSGKAQMK